MSPATTIACPATTFVLPDAVPAACTVSSSTAVPPTMTPGLNVRCGCAGELSRETRSECARLSKIAPAPSRARKICDECPVVPVTRQPPRRRAAPRDHRVLRIAVAVLEADRHRRAFRRRHQRFARRA